MARSGRRTSTAMLNVTTGTPTSEDEWTVERERRRPPPGRLVGGAGPNALRGKTIGYRTPTPSRPLRHAGDA